ncbi:Cyclin [Nakaseomyces glabratus]|nr:Cyclin [Nakaseomyces glabratus]
MTVQEDVDKDDGEGGDSHPDGFSDNFNKEHKGMGFGDYLMYSQEDSLFELPIKTGYNLNFSELNDSLPASNVPQLSQPSKKVRFENDEIEHDGNGSATSVSRDMDGSNGDNEDGVNTSQDDDLELSPKASANGKPREDIENLIQKASVFNEVLGENLAKLNTLSSDGLPSRVMSRMGSEMSTARSDSMSCFALSDSEGDGELMLDSGHSGSDPFTHSNILSQINGEYSEDDGVLLLSPYQSSTMYNNFIDTEIGPASSTERVNEEQFFEISPPENFQAGGNKTSDIVHDNTCVLLSKYQHNNEIFEYSVEDTMHNYTETLDILLRLSENENMISEKADNNENYHYFSMKSSPSISHHDFIQRIQNKCMFGSIIYLGATYLLQILFLTREYNDGPLRLKHKLQQNEVHRVIVGTIRIATKLLEDFVHSHQYICKVCGISKKLMTKLELALIFCLKDNNLLINSEKLSATACILEELKAQESQ